MEDMLHPMDHHGAVGLVVQPHDALHPQQMRPVGLAQEIEKQIKPALGHERVALKAESPDARVVTVHVVGVLRAMGVIVVVVIMPVIMAMMMGLEIMKMMIIMTKIRISHVDADDDHHVHVDRDDDHNVCR